MSLEDLTPLRDPRPLTLQAEEALTGFLAQCEPGERLPPEPELAHRMGVSRATLRESLRTLKDRGLITSRRGVGTFVQSRPPIIPSGLETLESVDALAARLGLVVRTARVTIEERLVGSQRELIQSLELTPDDWVTCVSRVKLAENHPVAYIEDMVPARVATVDELRTGFQDSVLDFLRQRGDPSPDYARANIRALSADKELAQKLALKTGAALLLLEETLYTTEGLPIDFSRNYFVPGYLGFHVIRRIGNG